MNRNPGEGADRGQQDEERDGQGKREKGNSDADTSFYGCPEAALGS